MTQQDQRVRDWLNGLEWDRKPRLDDMLGPYAKSDAEMTFRLHQRFAEIDREERRRRLRRIVIVVALVVLVAAIAAVIWEARG